MLPTRRLPRTAGHRNPDDPPEAIAPASRYVAVWRGESLEAGPELIAVASSPRYEPLAFEATAGQPLRIQVLGAGHDAGRVHLHLRRDNQ